MADYPQILAQLERIPELSAGEPIPMVARHSPDHPDRCQPATIYEFELPRWALEATHLDIVLDGKEYRLNPTELKRRYAIAETTMFRWDAANLDRFIRYYSGFHGVDCFLIYYNGRLSEIGDVVRTLSAQQYPADVYLHEWDLPYWQTFCGKDDYLQTWKHSAQSVQLA